MNFRALIQRVTNNDPMRFVLALLWTPFGALGGIVVALLIASGIADPAAFTRDLGTTLKFFFFIALAAPPFLMAITPLVGVTAHLLLLALGLRRWPAYAAFGLAAGATLAAPAAFLIGLPTMPDPTLNTVVGGAGGFGGALAFWIVLRPDFQPT